VQLRKTIIVFDQGGVSKTADWSSAYKAIADSIKGVVHPKGGTLLTIRRMTTIKVGKKKKELRNGVGFLKSAFFANLRGTHGWETEVPVDLSQVTKVAHEFEVYDPSEEGETFATTASNFGGFDFAKKHGTIAVAVEWETGNISSSHRSINKLLLALGAGAIQVGVLIVPSRELYEHLTDRIGNIKELAPYLGFWRLYQASVGKGMLCICVVQHDADTDDVKIPYLKVGKDGRAKQGRAALQHAAQQVRRQARKDQAKQQSK
jgi:hypothetical protein